MRLAVQKGGGSSRCESCRGPSHDSVVLGVVMLIFWGSASPPLVHGGGVCVVAIQGQGWRGEERHEGGGKELAGGGWAVFVAVGGGYTWLVGSRGGVIDVLQRYWPGGRVCRQSMASHPVGLLAWGQDGGRSSATASTVFHCMISCISTPV